MDDQFLSGRVLGEFKRFYSFDRLNVSLERMMKKFQGVATVNALFVIVTLTFQFHWLIAWLILILFLVYGWCFVLLALSSLRFLQTWPSWSMRRLCTWRERARVLPEEIEVAQGKIDELWTYFFSSHMCYRVLSTFSFEWFFSVYSTVRALKQKSWQDKTYGIERDPFCFSVSTISNWGFMRGGSWILFWQNYEGATHWTLGIPDEKRVGTSEKTRAQF